MKKAKNPFFDESLSVEKRIDWLLAAMTLDEKMKCLASTVSDIERLGVKGFSVGGEAAHGVEARNDQNGEGQAEPTTSFTQPIGMSATWDTELIRQAGEVTGREARVLYHRHPDRGLSRWAPTVDMERDPRWGRTEEGYGEDPLLAGAMAGAYVKGMQGDDPKYLRVAATLKHFYANNTEVGRVYKSSSVDSRNKMEYYLEPFRRAIEESHAEAIMTAYNKVNGVPAILNSEVQTILKDQYGLGHAVCDGGAMEMAVTMHDYYGIHAQTLAGAIRAGVDSMSDRPELVEQAAREAYELNLLTEEDMDQALRNMFRTKLRLGIYDKEGSNPYDRVGEDDLNSRAHQEICRQVAWESMVLLKNQGNMLPLPLPDRENQVAVIGPMADMWYPDWYGGMPPYTRTLKQGLEEIAGRDIACADGRDRVIFRLGDRGVAIREDGTLCLSHTPDIFICDDWGEGSLTFQSARTGKFMNTRLPGEHDAPSERGRIAAEKEATLDWFVMEIFHLERLENGTVHLLERFGSAVQIDEDGSLVSMREDGEPAEFHLEIVESGLEKAKELARTCDTVILALGCNSMVNAKEEVDRTTICLPPAQEALLEEIVRVNSSTVLVLLSNYPYAINQAQEKLPAILWSATGSQDMGTAAAEILFGLHAPAGRLNMTWYRSDDQLPDMDDYDIIQGKRTYRYFDGEVLYPFGHGLTYTTFDYTDLVVKPKDGTKLQVSFNLANTGTAASDEVVQIYGTAPASRVKKPLKQLIGFGRVKDMQPGEQRRIAFEIPMSEFRFYDVISRTMMVEEGMYRIAVGASSEDLRRSVFVQIPGRTTGFRNLTRRIAADHYDEYDNIFLTEGQFGFTSAAVRDPKRMGRLIYRDCILPDSGSLYLHLKSGEDGTAEIYLDGQKVGEFTGKTGGFTDVRVDLYPEEAGTGKADGEKTVELEIRISSHVKLCYFMVK
ncbi:MAG: glycoside hydrolase family 3 C-terminal domain-containing protein [Lachnospiraceae bacterium]